MSERFYTLIHGPMSGVIVSQYGRLHDTCPIGNRRPDLAAAAACYAWNGPPQPGLNGTVAHTNGDTSDCRFRNVTWQGREYGYDIEIRHINGILHDNRIENLHLNPDPSKPATCWAVAYDGVTCARCAMRTVGGPFCHDCTVAAAELTITREEIRIARGSKNAIQRTMERLNVTRAAIDAIEVNPGAPGEMHVVAAKATINSEGVLRLTGDVPKMTSVLSAGNSYITVAPRRQRAGGQPRGYAIIRRAGGDFKELVGGFVAIDTFMRLIR